MKCLVRSFYSFSLHIVREHTVNLLIVFYKMLQLKLYLFLQCHLHSLDQCCCLNWIMKSCVHIRIDLCFVQIIQVAWNLLSKLVKSNISILLTHETSPKQAKQTGIGLFKRFLFFPEKIGNTQNRLFSLQPAVVLVSYWATWARI